MINIITSPIDLSPRLERRISFLKTIVIIPDLNLVPVLSRKKSDNGLAQAGNHSFALFCFNTCKICPTTHQQAGTG